MKVVTVKIGKVEPTWDMEVDDVHEYLMSNINDGGDTDENAIVTHNTSQILGNTEAFRPKFNLITRRVLSGEYPILNQYLLNDLKKIGYENGKLEKFIKDLQASQGSIQEMDLPKWMKEKYKTPWEVLEKDITDMSADRGRFICQSQSLNRYIEDDDKNEKAKLTSMHFYAWEKGLKTGMYYLKQRQAQSAIQFTVEKNTKKKKIICTDEVCVVCGG
jgi:ribonucleoside-diphosphate reductase alpha chain